MSRRPRLPALSAAVLLAAVLAGCGSDEGSSRAPADCTPVESTAHTLVAENLAWDTDCLRVDEGTEIAFTVDLRDRSVDHNLAISGPSGDAETPLERGPKQQSLAYDASTAGRHRYVCDIHPTLEGDLSVDPAPG